MRIAPVVFLFFVGLALQPTTCMAYGQALITSGSDTVLVLTSVTDTTARKKQFFLSGLKNLGQPGKAALLSAALPGLGQAYNKAYWKLPIVYATGGVLGYFLIDNNNKYQDYRTALNTRNRGEQDKYYNHSKLGKQNGDQYLKYARDYYRRNLELTIILSAGAYALNIAEAYVHAHMKDFDVGDNLSLRVQPELHHIAFNNGVTPGLALTMFTRSR